MNTAKHLRGLSLLRLPKRRFSFWIKEYLPAMLLASLLGTILDLYFVGNGTYMFPHRPLPAIFSINIGFTLVVLPILVAVFLRMMTQVNPWGRAGIIFCVSLLAPVFEKLAEVCGIFIHSEKWSHLYTFFGYIVFLTVIYLFFHWTKTKTEA